MKRGIKPVTLSHLAKRLNLHVSTVSRVLNGDDEGARNAASIQTVTKIRALAKELDYRPNPHATSLRTRRSRNIGVLVPQLSDLVIATIYEGIDASAIDHGYLSFVSNTGDSPKRQQDLGELALSRGAEGLIFADARLDELGFINRLAGHGTPLVLVSRHAGNHCAVTCDDFQGGRLAAEHLLRCGHRDFAILTGERYASTGVDRTSGFIVTCREHSVEIPSDRILHGSFHTHSGREAGDYLFGLARKSTAIFTVNDFLAIGLMGAARDHGVIPGRDVAIVGYNDTALAAQLPISLTSVRSPRHEMGYRSLQLLLECIDGKTPESEQLAPELIIRASSDPKRLGLLSA